MALRARFRVLALLCAVLVSQHLARGGTTWDGGGVNASWGTFGNWSPDGLPLFNGTEQITIGSGFASGLTMTLDGNRYIDSLLINTISGFTLASGTGGTLNLRSGNITRQNVTGTEATQTISAGIVLGDPTGAAAYTGTWSLGGSNGLVVSGNISEAGGSRAINVTGGQVELAGNNSFSGGVGMLAGSKVIVSQDANLGAASGGIRLGGGILDVRQSFTSARNLFFTGASGSGIYVASGKVFELTGAISGNGDLTISNSVANAGTLILSGSGSNGTGMTVFGANAVLSIRGSVALGSGGIAFYGGGTLELGNGNFTRALGTGAGQISLTSTGAGAGFAAWGATRIVNLGGNGAMVTWGSGSFVGDNELFYLGSTTGNATLDFQNGINLNGATRTIALTRGTGAGADGKISGVISGTDGFSGLSITSTNGGRLLLTNGNNSYAGGTGINSGSLWLGANATSGAGNTVLGTSSNPVTLTNEASLMTAAAITIGKNITLMSGSTATATLGGVTADVSTFSGTISLGSNTTAGRGVTLSAVSGGTVNFSGVISDPAGLSGTRGVVTKAGAGTVVLSAANTYAGATVVNSGALNLRNSAALGSTAGGTTVNAGAELQLQGGIAVGAESLTLNGTGVGGNGALRNMSGNNSWAGNITLGMTSLIESLVGQLTLSGTLGNGGNAADFYFGGAGDIVVSGAITGNGDVAKEGTGTLTLAGANTYTGATIVNGGTLRLTGGLNGALGTALIFGGNGTFNFNGAAGTARNMGVLTFGAGGGTVQSTYGGSGNTSLTFSSLGTMGVGATGNFIISGGTNGTTNRISITGLPVGVINSATFFNGDSYAYVDPAGFIRAINYGVDPGTAESPGGVSLSGDHVKANGHITSQGTQRFETLHIASNIQYTIGTNQKVTVGGILKTGNVAGGATIVGGDYLRPDFNANLTIRTSRENDSLNIFSSILANGNNAVVKSGAGTLTLAGVNTYSAGTYINEGTLQIGASERLLNTGGITVRGGTFDLQNFTETVGPVLLQSGAINGSGAGTLIGTSYDTWSGSASAILAGTASLTKNTGGTVTLTGANTYTGTTTINDGTLVAASTAGGALAGTTAIMVAGDGNLALGASNQINDAASVTLAGGTLSKGDFSEGTSTSVGAGTLSLAAEGSHIDFGTGAAGTLAFAIFNPGSFSLIIDNWTGTAGAIGNDSTDRLIFAADPTANLANFIFSGYGTGAVALLLDGGFYEVTPGSLTPVPEINPAFVASAACVGFALFFHSRAVRARRRRDALC